MATPLELQNNLKRFNEGINNVYGGPSIYGDQPGFNFGFRQPYVWVKQTDPDIIKYIKKFDSRAFPIGSAAQDVLRIGKLMVSGKGVAFLATQFLLQGQAAFNETNLYNPLEVMLATARPLSLGLVPRPKRFLDTSGDALGALVRAFGLQAASNARPAGTVRGGLALPTNETLNSKGLIRARTAAAGKANIDLKWSGKEADKRSILTNLISQFAPGLAPMPTTNEKESDGTDIKFRADENTSDKMLVDYGKIGTGVSRLQPVRSKLTPPTYQTFKQKYSSQRVGNEQKNYSSHISNQEEINPPIGGTDLIIRGDQTPSQFNGTTTNISITKIKRGNKNLDFENERVKTTNQNLLKSLRKIEGYTIDPQAIANIKTYSIINSIAKSSNQGVSGKNINQTFESLVGQKQALENPEKKGFPGYGKSDQINLEGVQSYDEKSGIPNRSEFDQIVFYFEDVVNNRFIPFRATVKGINDSINPEWQDIRYMGRADKIVTYRGFSRELNFNFAVYASSISELLPMWQKINYLMGLGKPSKYTNFTDKNGGITGAFIVPPFVKIRIGDMYKNQPAILTSIGLSVPEDASWETLSGVSYEYLNGSISSNDKTAQFPTRVEIQVNMSLLEKERPETNMLNFNDMINASGGGDKKFKSFENDLVVGGAWQRFRQQNDEQLTGQLTS